MADIETLLNLKFDGLNKPDLKEKAQELQTALKEIAERSSSTTNTSNVGIENILLRLQLVENRQLFSTTELERLQKENKSLKKRVAQLERQTEEDMEYVEDRFYEIEKAVANCEQYTRRENFEVSGIPADVADEILEEKVLDIVNIVTGRTDDNPLRTPLLPNDIHACHRLKKEQGEEVPKVIVRMVNRKNTIEVLKNKKMVLEKQDKLNNPNLFINENLCNSNKNLLEEARKLKKNGLLKRCWTFNGVTHIKIKETDAKGKKIFHMSEFEKFFTSKELGWE